MWPGSCASCCLQSRKWTGSVVMRNMMRNRFIPAVKLTARQVANSDTCSSDRPAYPPPWLPTSFFTTRVLQCAVYWNSASERGPSFTLCLASPCALTPAHRSHRIYRQCCTSSCHRDHILLVDTLAWACILARHPAAVLARRRVLTRWCHSTTSGP